VECAGGGRQDFGAGPARTWAAIGVQGLAPYWFNTEATFYVGEQGRTAMRLKSEYELLFTQRLILQPEAEANLYGKSDPGRQLAPVCPILRSACVFVTRCGGSSPRTSGSFGRANLEGRRSRAGVGGNPSDVQFVAGVRAWF